mmetsp:Transcript_25021/g.58211  ORF Transcript_25021/g.58211 Transcript_25021/m.58211 type:complete len:125 (+) Transcript_25021:194-568(+)
MRGATSTRFVLATLGALKDRTARPSARRPQVVPHAFEVLVSLARPAAAASPMELAKRALPPLAAEAAAVVGLRPAQAVPSARLAVAVPVPLLWQQEQLDPQRLVPVRRNVPRPCWREERERGQR